MRSPRDPRHVARIIAIMDLYSHFFTPDHQDISILNPDSLEFSNYSKTLREKLVSGVRDNIKSIDELIDSHSDPVKSTDLDILLLQIVRVAIYEGFIIKSVPPKVAIDEAIELTRDFGLELSTRKVSGILGKVFDKTLKKD